MKPRPTSSLLLFKIIVILFEATANAFSLPSSGLTLTNDIRRKTANYDATTLTPALWEALFDKTLDYKKVTLSFSSDFSSNKNMSAEQYFQTSSDRHDDCINLLDRYTTTVQRCESIISTTATAQEYNVRWDASWIGASSVWLYSLADTMGWEIEQIVPDPTKVSSFSWLAVIQMFQTAFQTGIIPLPVFRVEGATRLKVVALNKEVASISIVESIDLVREADCSRLYNRRVAQEFASWLDVSRRPPMDENDWAAVVRERILTNVPGAGPLDVDPNDDGPEVIVAFGAFCLATFAGLYYFLMGEVVGGTGQVSKLCDDAARIEVGSGYFSECFGPDGSGPFL